MTGIALWGTGHVHTPTPAFVGFAIVLLCCGGGFGTMPSYSAQCFGTRYMGLNYGLVLTAWGVAVCGAHADRAGRRTSASPLPS